MSLLGFLKFVLNFLDLLAWPLFALGYPLYASIQAIENNSNSDTQKLVTYWISFSLVSLFEHSFVNLLQWIQFWPYIKLMTIYWLVIPYFNGAFYVYNHLIRPCLLLNPQVIIDEFNKWMVLLWKRDYFLAEAERYIKGNGPEVLEKLIDKESHSKEPDIVQKDNKIVEVIEKKEVPKIKRMVIPEPSLEFNQTDNKTSATMEIKGPDVAVAAARELPEIPTESEKTLNIHLHEKKHKPSYIEALKAKNKQDNVNFGSFFTVLDSTEKRSYQPIEKPQEIESTNGLKWQGQPKSVSSSTAKEYDRPQKQVPKKSILTDEKKHNASKRMRRKKLLV